MKFLLWQFGAYAAAAMAIGAGLSLLWARAARAGLDRERAHAERELAFANGAVAALEEQRSRDAVRLDEAAEVLIRNAELQGRLSLAGADLHASELAQREAERRTAAAHHELDRVRTEAGPGLLAMRDADRLRAQLAELRQTFTDARRQHQVELAGLRSSLSLAEANLVGLQRAHDEQVATHQRELSAAHLDAEDLRARLSMALKPTLPSPRRDADVSDGRPADATIDLIDNRVELGQGSAAFGEESAGVGGPNRIGSPSGAGS